MPACRCAWQKALGKSFNPLQGNLAFLLYYTGDVITPCSQITTNLGFLKLFAPPGVPLSLVVVLPGQPPALSLRLTLPHLPPRFTGLPCPSVPLSPREWEHPRPPTVCSDEPSAPRGKIREMAASAQRSQCSRQGRLAGRIPMVHPPCVLGSSLGSDQSPKPRALCGICLTWKQPPTLALLSRR